MNGAHIDVEEAHTHAHVLSECLLRRLQDMLADCPWGNHAAAHAVRGFHADVFDQLYEWLCRDDASDFGERVACVQHAISLVAHDNKSLLCASFQWMQWTERHQQQRFMAHMQAKHSQPTAAEEPMTHGFVAPYTVRCFVREVVRSVLDKARWGCFEDNRGHQPSQSGHSPPTKKGIF